FVTGVVVGKRPHIRRHPQSGIETELGDVDAHHDRFGHVPTLPSLQMRCSVQQLFGLRRNGRDGAPSAQTRAWKPRGATGCAAVPETTRAVDLWTMACRPPGRLPWKSLTTFPPRSPSPTSSTA